MKNKILFSLCFILLLVNSCKKEKDDVISESISGHVYEEGSGNLIAGADLFLIAQDYGSWPRTEQMAHAKTDQNGAFTISNARHSEIDRHYLVAHGFDYYELNSTTDKTKYEASISTKNIDIHLYRKAKIKVRLLNGGGGDHIEVRSNRQTIKWLNNAILDTTLSLDLEANVPALVRYYAESFGKHIYGDTTILSSTFLNTPLLFNY